MMVLRKLLLPVVLCLVAAGYQPLGVSDQPAQSREGQLFNALPARCIGPANFGGRITEVAVVESNPAVMYIAVATGGVFKTTDGGATAEPVFDGATSLCIGAVAVAQSKPDVVWVGTGEGNILRSVSIGDGVYRSTDGGKTWQHMGLKETRHIARIVIHPKNPDIVYVAALGRGFGQNTERGLFKTIDAGKTWSRVFYIDATTGVTDVALDPSDPATVYACAYTFHRDAFSGSTPRVQFGPKAGLYKSTDGGKSWDRLQAGLPERELGRCGIDVYRKDPNVLFAIVQTDKSSKGGGMGGGGGDDKEAGGVYRSADKGKTWTRLGMVNPQHWFYFGQIRVDPNDEQRVYVLGVSLHISTDGGKTFGSKGGGTHADHHALWINPKNSDHVILGNDGGLYVSKDRAKSWQAQRSLAIGQFYGIAVDMRKPYRVYGGLQDNGSWGGPNATHNEAGITLKDWYSVGGGDGFYCQVDPTDPDIVYCESQEGALRRVDLKAKGGGMGGGGGGGNIRPQEKGARYNWNSPILISPHDNKTIYFGGQYLFKSANRGDNWTKISPDLSRGGVKQDTGHTITTIAESKLKAGLLWVGTDDGRLHVSKNGGKDWLDVSKNVPALTDIGWVTRIVASYHAEGTAYLTVDRHRNDDLRPYAYKTTDFGETWISVNGDMPAEGNLHCIRESSKNPNLLFLGTEFGLYGTLDGGQHWHNMKNGIPAAVLVHDLVIHPRDRELVVGTHGRSIYVIDIAPLEELTPKILASTAHLCEVRPVTEFKIKQPAAKEVQGYVGTNPPYGATIYYYVKDTGPQVVKFSLVDKDGRVVVGTNRQQQPGLHRILWDLRPGLGNDGPTVAPGDYTISMQMGNRFFSKSIHVEAE